MKTLNNTLARCSKSLTEKRIIGAIKAYIIWFETENNSYPKYNEKLIKAREKNYYAWLKKIIGDEKKQKRIDDIIRASFDRCTSEAIIEKVKKVLNEI